MTRIGEQIYPQGYEVDFVIDVRIWDVEGYVLGVICVCGFLGLPRLEDWPTMLGLLTIIGNVMRY